MSLIVSTNFSKEKFLDLIKIDPIISQYTIEIHDEIQSDDKNFHSKIFLKMGENFYYLRADNDKIYSIVSGHLNVSKPFYSKNPIDVILKFHNVHERIKESIQKITDIISEDFFLSLKIFESSIALPMR